MKKFTIKYYVVVLCLILSLMSTGFASWIVAEDSAQKAIGTFDAFEAVEDTSYIKLSNKKVSAYSKEGFVTNEPNADNSNQPTFAYNGTIVTTYTLDTQKTKTLFEGKNSLKIQFVLKGIAPTQTATNIFNAKYMQEPTVNVKCGSTTITPKKVTIDRNNSGQVATTVYFENIFTQSPVGSYSITITYPFQMEKAVYDSEFYPAIKPNKGTGYSFTSTSKMDGIQNSEIPQ